MRTAALLALIALVGVAVAGCYSTPIMPPSGWIYSDVKAPLDPNLQQTTLGNGKPGVAVSKSILGLVATGDCSIDTAAKNGGLKTITYADYQYVNVFGVFQEFTVRVYGQP